MQASKCAPPKMKSTEAPRQGRWRQSLCPRVPLLLFGFRVLGVKVGGLGGYAKGCGLLLSTFAHAKLQPQLSSTDENCQLNTVEELVSNRSCTGGPASPAIPKPPLKLLQLLQAN